MFRIIEIDSMGVTFYQNGKQIQSKPLMEIILEEQSHSVKRRLTLLIFLEGQIRISE